MAAKGSKGKGGQVEGIPAQLEKLGKFGLGAMARPETACWVARSILFHRMQKMLTDDLQKLRDSSLPHYRLLQLCGRVLLPGDTSDVPALLIREVLPKNVERSRRLYIANWSSLGQAAEHFPAAKDLMAALTEWAGARHMGTNWFLDSALDNLSVWAKSPQAEKDLWWLYSGVLAGARDHRVGPDAQILHGWGTLDHKIAVPVLKRYNPSAQTREEHQRDLQRELDRYYDEQEGIFAEAGFQKTVLKRRRAGDDPWLHFDWFIAYQIQGRSGSQIAQKYRQGKLGEDAIHRALRGLANTLQVTLRPKVRQRSKRT